MVAQGYWTTPATPGRCPPDVRASGVESQRDAQEPRPAGHRPAGRGLVVERAQRAGRVEVVVERRPHGRQPDCAARRRPGRCATAPAVPPPRACPRRSASPSRRGSGGPAGPAAPRPGPIPCRGRRRRPGCRATWTSWCRRGRPGPTWNHSRTKGCPVTDSDWAASHSWCGNTRSRPPPWMSIVSPSSRSASAEHSMCQPGRPGPQRDSHAGSSGSDGCHSTKSSGLALVGVVRIAAVLGGQLQHAARGRSR